MRTRAPHPTAPFLSSRRVVSRRSLLKGAGVALSLPFLETMTAPLARADSLGADETPRRMLGICNNLGLLPAHFFPSGGGAGYAPSPYLELLREHRDDFTVFGGVSHPNVDGGHPSDISFLTACDPAPDFNFSSHDKSGFR